MRDACSIKPSLQHFQFCRVGLSLGILYLTTLSYVCYFISVNDTIKLAKEKTKYLLNAQNLFFSTLDV
jgi:hypothetical protein